MWTFVRLVAFVFTSLLLTVTAFAGDGVTAWGPVYDITHFDVLPVTSPDFEQIAYGALFKYRDASRSDPGLESFRVVNWVLASNPFANHRRLAQPRRIRATPGAASQR